MINGRARSLHAGEIGRQAIVVTAIDQQGHLAIEQIGQIRNGIFHAVHRKRDMAAIEMPAVQNALALGIDDRIIVGAIEFVFDRLAQPRQRIRQNADHVRRTTDRIAVLQTLAVARRLIARQILAQPCSHALLARMRLDRKQSRIEMVGVAVQRKRCERGNPRGQPGQVLGARIRQTGQRRHHRSAVHDRQPFLRPQAQRRNASVGQRLRRRHLHAVAPHFALAAQYRGKIRQGREIAAGADRTFGRYQRQQSAFKQSGNLFQQFDADAGVTLAQRRKPRCHHRPCLGRIEIFTQSAAMVGVQMVRQFGHQFRRHRDRARIAITGSHTINRAVFA